MGAKTHLSGLELFLLGRKLVKAGEEAMPPLGFHQIPASVRLVLIDVFDHPGSSVSEITARTGLPRGHVSASVARLRDRGGLVTATDPADHRRTLVSPGIQERLAQPSLARIDALLACIVGGCPEQASDGQPAAGRSPALSDPAIRTALNRMHADPARRWTVAGLAAAAGLSRSAFARRFTTLTGRPPMAYLGWWRMTVAARLLRETDAPLAAVARQTGYTSEYAFANAFKREYGIAPGKYRAIVTARRDSTTAFTVNANIAGPGD